MTEAEWFACTNPTKMLMEIGFAGVTHRKSRLFCCAYCRCFFWDYLATGIRDAIEIAEAYADGVATKYRLRKAQAAFGLVGESTNAAWRANLAAEHATASTDPYRSSLLLLENRNTRPWRGDRRAIARLIREIFGFPFGPARTITPSILAWSNGTIPKLAQGIYDERAFDRLPVLADALEEAGADAELVDHLRDPGPHWRGCHILDLLLGKS